MLISDGVGGVNWHTKTILRSHAMILDRKSFCIFLVIADFVPEIQYLIPKHADKSQSFS